MPESFGSRLRQRREERQIDLIAISERTKIKVALLEGLETDDVSAWPSGIFRRAYIRAYAQMVGLDPDEILREFSKVHPDPGDAIVTTAAAAAAAEEQYAKTLPTLRLRTIVDSAFASLSRRHAAVGTNAAHTPAVAPDEAVVADPVASSGDPTSDAGTATRDDQATDTTAAEVRAADEASLERLARLCTELGRVADQDELQKLLEECAGALNASGLIVWLWDDRYDALRPGLVHGYSDKVLAHLPAVGRDADNATAESFRTQAPCELAPSTHGSGALVMPMLAVEGCTGVLAIELQQGIGVTPSRRATAMTLAAALTQVIGRSRAVAHEPRERLSNQFRRPAPR
jgi:transcriptional regulator with XRE-family HTH domain